MVGRSRAGGRSAPRHARPRRVRTVALLVAGGLAALCVAILLVNVPGASAESSTTTATLTLTGVRDSNCDFSTGGTTVYVKPGGTVTFKAELTGLQVTVPLLGTIDVTSSQVASFKDKLIIDGHTNNPHYVVKGKTYVWNNVTSGTHKIAWSANSITLVSGLVIPLTADNTSLPAGGQLDWVGSVKASKGTKCGISVEVPGGGVTVGPVTTSVPPVTTVPTVPVSAPSLPSLSGGSSSSSSAPSHPGGSHSSSPRSGGSTTASGLPTPIPQLVVPNAGSGGDSAFGGGGIGGVGALPDNGDIGPIAPDDVTSTAPAPHSSAPSSPKPVDLATNSTDGGLGGAQLPVLLAIVAIIALSLVTATYARMYLLRKPPAA